MLIVDHYVPYILCEALETNVETMKSFVKTPVSCTTIWEPCLAILSTTNIWNLRNRFSVSSTGRGVEGSREPIVAFHTMQKFTDFLN